MNYSWLFAEFAENVPDNVVATTAAGLMLGILFKLFLVLKKDVLDEQSRRLKEAAEERLEMRTRITKLERRNRKLEQAVSRAGINIPPDESDKP